MKNWKRRFFVLTELSFSYYKTLEVSEGCDRCDWCVGVSMVRGVIGVCEYGKECVGVSVVRGMICA